MKNIIKLLIVSLLSSCATYDETRWIQRVQKEGPYTFAIGPAVEIKLTKKQLRKIRNSEHKINIKDSLGGNQYPLRVIYLNKWGIDSIVHVGPYIKTKTK